MVTNKTKRGEIREGTNQLIAFYMLGDYWNDLTPEQRDLVEVCTDHIVARESDMGVALKADKNGLMVAFHKFDNVGHNEESHGVDTKLCPRCQLVKFMLAIDNEGMVAVESLI